MGVAKDDGNGGSNDGVWVPIMTIGILMAMAWIDILNTSHVILNACEESALKC